MAARRARQRVGRLAEALRQRVKIRALSFDYWILALHVISAFILVAGVVFFWVLIVAGRNTDTPDAMLRLGPLSRAAEAAVGIGGVGTIGLGVILAFSFGGYDIWDGWIVAGIVLWVIAMGLGSRASAAYGPAVTKALELQRAGQTGPNPELLALNRASNGLILQALVSLAVLLIIIDMIWKPGA